MAKKPVLVCVFAHPDDEAFGPAGTIHKFTKTHDVYLLCATKGQVGQDSILEPKKRLTERRVQELRTSAKILGVKQVYFLGFKDGTLSNNLYHKLAEKIKLHFEKLNPEIVMTYEPHGISGHIDHIAVSFVAQFVLRDHKKSVKELWMYCLKKGREEFRNSYFVYFPKGYEADQIDKVMNVEDVWDLKVAAMHAHVSQIHDAKEVLRVAEKFPKEEYFLVKSLNS